MSMHTSGRGLVAAILATSLTFSAGCDEDLVPGQTTDTTSEDQHADLESPGEDTTPAVDTTPAEDAAPTEDTATGQDAAPAEDTTPLSDATEPTDTAPEDATADATTDVSSDTAADTAAEDTAGPTCEATCPGASVGDRGIALVYHGPSVQPPVLTGLAEASSPPSGRYVVERLDIYPTDAVSPLVSVSVSDNHDETDARGTQGAFQFDAEVWKLSLGLDLRFQGGGFGFSVDEVVSQDLEGGGCWDIDGAELVGDLSHCAEGWPESIEPPDRALFAYDSQSGQLRWQLVVTKEFMGALFPDDFAALAGLIITGDLVFVLTAQAELPASR